MQIAMILDNHFPPDSRVENEAKLLLSHGHEVFLFSLSKTPSPAIEFVNGIKVYRYKRSWFVTKLSALVYTVPFYSWIVSSKIEDFISRVNPDVLHVHDMVIADAAYRANRKHDLPFVLDLHENRPEIMELYRHVNQFPGNILINLDTWRSKQRELIQQADHTVVVTEEAKEVVLKNNMDVTEKSVIVVPNTIDKELYYGYGIHPEVTKGMENNFNLIYVGDTALRRGTDTAIKAVALLRKNIPNVMLTLVGTSSQQDKLKELAANYDLQNHVNFQGWKDVSLFPSFIKASDICLSPLKRNLHHDTTYANKLFQYMAMAKPVVVSNCPAQAHVVKKEGCGLVHEAGDEVDLAEKILMLYRNDDLRKSMGERGHIAVQKRYHWDKTGADLVGLYDDIKAKDKSSRN